MTILDAQVPPWVQSAPDPPWRPAPPSPPGPLWPRAHQAGPSDPQPPSSLCLLCDPWGLSSLLDPSHHSDLWDREVQPHPALNGQYDVFTLLKGCLQLVQWLPSVLVLLVAQVFPQGPGSPCHPEVQGGPHSPGARWGQRCRVCLAALTGPSSRVSRWPRAPPYPPGVQWAPPSPSSRPRQRSPSPP